MEKAVQEIRILSGLQAGASLVLPPGEYILGAGEQCDILLNDRQMSAEHAKLVIDETGIYIYGKDGTIVTLSNELQEGEIAPGTLFRAGNTWLVIDEAEAAWPDIEAVFSEMKPAKLASTEPGMIEEEKIEPALSELDEVNTFNTEEDEEEASLQTTTNLTVDKSISSVKRDSTVSPIPQFLRKNGLKAVADVGVLAISFLCIMLAFIPNVPNKELLSQQTNNKNKLHIEQLLQNMHLQQRVTVVENKQGKLVISGYLAKAQDMTALVDALAKLNTKAELRLFSEETIVNAAAHILLTAQLPIQVSNLGMGRIRLTGAASNYESIDALLQKINTHLDGLRGIESEILVGEQLVAKLRQMIVDSGLAGKVVLTVNKGEAIINGALDVREMATWEQLMAQFVVTYGNILPIRASFPPTANMLPFKVLSAFSGDMPFIVTGQGEKIMLGGHIKGYTLVNITEKEIVFDGPRKVQIQR